MNALLDKRLTKLELVHTPPAELRERQRFFIKGYGDSDVADFLRQCGHEVRDGDIIRTIVSPAPEGGPLFEPCRYHGRGAGKECIRSKL